MNLGDVERGEGSGFEEMSCIYCDALEQAISMSFESWAVLWIAMSES